MIQCFSRLGDGGCPAKVGLELRRALKIGNVANHSDDDSRLDRSNPWDRGEDLALTRVFDDAGHLDFELFKVLKDKLEFFNQLTLFESETTKPCRIFRPNALSCQLLQFQQSGIRERTVETSDLLKGGQADCCERSWGREGSSQGKSRRQIRIFADLDELGENLVADRYQLVFPSGTFYDEFIAVSDHAVQLSRRFCRRGQATDRVPRIADLDTFFQLIEQQVGQAKCIPLVCFEQSFESLLNMK